MFLWKRNQHKQKNFWKERQSDQENWHKLSILEMEQGYHYKHWKHQKDSNSTDIYSTNKIVQFLEKYKLLQITYINYTEKTTDQYL